MLAFSLVCKLNYLFENLTVTKFKRWFYYACIQAWIYH